jgi:hypothetical protein
VIDMEDSWPASDKGRPNLLKRAAGASGERLSAIVGAERTGTERPGKSGLEKTGLEKPASEKSVIDKRIASLAVALRRARVENAEHSEALADLRAAEIVRLEILADALTPVLAQVPPDCDIFDVAVSPGERPRLFIDQIGFVEMARDRRTYRFLQDTRHGRITLRESADVDELVDAATDYMAHRLIERDKALAVDFASGGAARAVNKNAAARETTGGDAFGGKAFQFFLFFIEFLGSAAFFGLLAILAMWAYRTYVAP